MEHISEPRLAWPNTDRMLSELGQAVEVCYPSVQLAAVRRPGQALRQVSGGRSADGVTESASGPAGPAPIITTVNFRRKFESATEPLFKVKCHSSSWSPRQPHFLPFKATESTGSYCSPIQSDQSFRSQQPCLNWLTERSVTARLTHLLSIHLDPRGQMVSGM